MNQIHGHEVMEMLIASGKTYTREALIAEIVAKFGADARFHTCSAENMTAADMVTFLERRGKLATRTGGFGMDADAMCQH